MALTLATVETAIEAIQTTGQSFTVDGVTYNRGSLSTLVLLRDKLAAEESSVTGQRPATRGFSFTGMGYD